MKMWFRNKKLTLSTLRSSTSKIFNNFFWATAVHKKSTSIREFFYKEQIHWIIRLGKIFSRRILALRNGMFWGATEDGEKFSDETSHTALIHAKISESYAFPCGSFSASSEAVSCTLTSAPVSTGIPASRGWFCKSAA